MGFVSCVWLTGMRAAVQAHRNAFELLRPSSPPRPGACPTRAPPSQPINFTTAQQKQDTDSQKKKSEREKREKREQKDEILSLSSAIRFASLNKDPWNSVNIFGLYWTHLVEVCESAGKTSSFSESRKALAWTHLRGLTDRSLAGLSFS